MQFSCKKNRNKCSLERHRLRIFINFCLMVYRECSLSFDFNIYSSSILSTSFPGDFTVRFRHVMQMRKFPNYQKLRLTRWNCCWSCRKRTENYEHSLQGSNKSSSLFRPSPWLLSPLRPHPRWPLSWPLPQRAGPVRNEKLVLLSYQAPVSLQSWGRRVHRNPWLRSFSRQWRPWRERLRRWREIMLLSWSRRMIT